MARRRYRIVHESYLVEWLGFTYPAGTWRTNVRLGAPKRPPHEKRIPEVERLLLGAFGGSVDAIVFLADKIILVEAMVRHEPGSIEDLKKYKKLFLQTEEFRQHWDKPIELVLVTPLDMPFYEELCKDEGIRVEKYRPP